MIEYLKIKLNLRQKDHLLLVIKILHSLCILVAHNRGPDGQGVTKSDTAELLTRSRVFFI